ncbi:zinc ABC transporter, permease [Deferribacter desulfuricans SSM1]|uniref:Zinc ABC transporter, permease n=1 Tax=Deferribacter desulfuricans (strain DSM 14783 / JCM 11476 / NBRC 101012 / SSM1) TaxID=639282 RepID=D3P9J9_DEFDS|nr:metal ABC transporter permease [Deferribacter desulfuricans]BAI81389.1 zinc ABC transporter, permease [Deferribacter desulfuricans SSM1]
MNEIFNVDIIKYAFLNGIIVSVLCGFLSFFVVQKKMSFLTVTISHSAFGAIALALLLKINQMVTLYILCFLIAFAVYELKKRSKLEFETVLGIFFASSMALGVVLIKFADYGAFDLSGILFGSILSTGKQDLYLSGVTSFLIFGIFVILLDKIIFTMFDEDVAAVSGINTNLINYIILISITLVVVICIKLIGIILLTAFMTIPAAIALSLTKDYRFTIFISILVSLLIFIFSFYLSYQFDLPPGATTVLVGTFLYLVVNVLKKR